MNSDKTDVVIECKSLVKDFKDFWGRSKVRALDGFDMQVRQGEVFGLLGPNGSGKTTTMKIILGLLFGDAGEVKVLGREPSNIEARARIGFLPEETYLHRFLTGAETLAFHGKLFDIPKAECLERSKMLLEKVGMTHAKDRRIGEYSRGMGRRIGLAQALINKPDVVLLDEPTAGLDPIATREVKDLILELKNEGITVILSSHLLADVEDVCDRIVILHRGKRCRYGTVDEILERGSDVRFTASNLSAEAIKEVESLLKDKGENVKIDHPRETLESVFLREVNAPVKAVDAPVTSDTPSNDQ